MSFADPFARFQTRQQKKTRKSVWRYGCDDVIYVGAAIPWLCAAGGNDTTCKPVRCDRCDDANAKFTACKPLRRHGCNDDTAKLSTG